jgi:OPA family glycerol-3-phosphate transporter-like MFS transporter
MQVVMFATTGVMILMLMLQPIDAVAKGDGSFGDLLIAWRPTIIGTCAVSTMMAVIGVHSIMSGTATADFGGKKSAATATGIADAFAKLGSAIQAFVLGILTTQSWTYWPMFLFPFTIIGLVFAIKMWKMMPAATRRYLAEVEGKKV